MNFQQKLNKIIEKNNSLLCVGLDSDFEKITDKFKKAPTSLKLRGASKNPQFEFNKRIIKQTHDLVCAYKLNSAFYEAEGLKGLLSLKLTIWHLKKNHPDIPVILDAKRGDIGSTNIGYFKFAFEFLQADAITLHPFLGRLSLTPFLKLKDKGIFILCRTSNPGAGELQDLKVKGVSMYRYIATVVSSEWNTNANCMLVVGATYPKELAEIRKTVGDMTLLVPGIGAQGGDLEKILKTGLNSEKAGLILNSSRGIIFSKDPRNETKKLKNNINKFRM